jgi:hypothetical protein
MKIMPNRSRELFKCGLATFLIIAAMCSTLSFAYGQTQITVTVNATKNTGKNSLSLGMELTGEIGTFQSSSALRDLASKASFRMVRFINRFMEPCTQWNEASKTGTFQWTKIDSLIKNIIQIGAEPLICLGFFNWNTNKLVKPKGMTDDPATGLPRLDQWAAYCTAWVKHFQTVNLPVKYYEIVNEEFFYYGWNPTQPKLGNYVKLFNQAAGSMRQVNPNVKISFDDSNKKVALNYFLTQGGKLDFIDFHRYGSSSISATDQTLLTAAENLYINDSSAKYGIDTARQVYKNARGVTLPVIMSEGNLNSAYSSGTDSRTRKMLGAVYTALSIRTFMLKNLSYTVYHNFGSKGSTGVGMVDTTNNKPWYPYYAQQMIANNLAVGDSLVDSTSSSGDIRVIAWIHAGTLNTLLICKANAARTVYMSGLKGTMNYLKIDNTISWQTPRIQTGTLAQGAPITLNGYAVALLQSKP